MQYAFPFSMPLRRLATIGILSFFLSVPYALAEEKPLYTCPDLANPGKQLFEPMTQGHDGWFFRINSDFKQEFQPTSETVSYLTRFAQALEKQGTRIIFLSIPSRGVAAAAFLDKSQPAQAEFDAPYAQASYQKLLTELRTTGLLAPDLNDISRVTPGDAEPFFFKRDHHWTPAGARRVAQKIAEIIAQDPRYGGLPKSTFTTEQTGTQDMQHTMAMEVQRLCSSEIPPEPFPLFETKLTTPSAETALFGNAGTGAPIVLVGSSFSATSFFNFDGFLSQYTGLEVANHALSAGLLFNAILSLVSAPDFAQQQPAFLIWETSSIYDLNVDTTKYFRQLLPAVYGVCDAADTVATGELDIREGQSGTLLHLAADQNIHGHDYYLVIESSDLGFAEFTLQMDYADEDGEWVSVNRSQHFNNTGRFFLELSDDIESPLVNVSIDALPDINTHLKVRLCKAKK